MDSPAQRTLRFASELCVLYFVLAIYGVYMDCGILALVWKFAVAWILQRAVVSLKKHRTLQQQHPNISGTTSHGMVADLETFPGFEYVSPVQHRTVGARCCRAVALHAFPLLMHLFVYLGSPLQNDNASTSFGVGGMITEFDYLALQRDIAEAGDMPAAALRWQSTAQSTKFWSFTAGPEMVTLSKLACLDALTIALLYVVLSLLVAAAGGSLPAHGLVQLLPLRDASQHDSHSSDERNANDDDDGASSRTGAGAHREVL